RGGGRGSRRTASRRRSRPRARTRAAPLPRTPRETIPARREKERRAARPRRKVRRPRARRPPPTPGLVGARRASSAQAGVQRVQRLRGREDRRSLPELLAPVVHPRAVRLLQLDDGPRELLAPVARLAARIVEHRALVRLEPARHRQVVVVEAGVLRSGTVAR